MAGCDNKESLRMCDNECWFASHQKDHDSPKSLQLGLQTIGINLVGHWVKGHQDDECVVKNLDWWDKWNVRCDQLAKAYPPTMVNVQPRPTPCDGWFPKENVRTFVKDGKLTCLKKGETHDSLAFNKMVDHWIKKECISETTVPLIGRQWRCNGEIVLD